MFNQQKRSLQELSSSSAQRPRRECQVGRSGTLPKVRSALTPPAAHALIT